MIRNQFAGTWQLVSCEFRNAEGQMFYPYGKDAIGYLMYSQDGYMSVVIMTANRPRFAAEDILKRSAQEKAAADETYFSYCGKYEIQAHKVIHYVDASLSPNLVGTAQERFFEIKENRLSLRTFVLVSGKEQTASHLIWERILTKDGVEY